MGVVISTGDAPTNGTKLVYITDPKPEHEASSHLRKRDKRGLLVTKNYGHEWSLL